MGLEFDSYDPNFINLGDLEEVGIEDSLLDEGYLILPAKLENHEALNNETSMGLVRQMVMAGNVPVPIDGGVLKNGRVGWYGLDEYGRAETSSLYEKDIWEIKETLKCQSTS